jgi:hypothetical protein
MPSSRVVEQRAKYKWMNLDRRHRDRHHLDLLHPSLHPGRLPFNEDFDWKFVNYAPILTGGSLIVLAIWWQASAKKWFTGPKVTIDQAVVDAFSD